MARGIEYDVWADGANLAMTMDQHLYSMVAPFAKRFEAEHGVRVAVKEGTCSVSQGLLVRKRVDMGGFCCPPAASDRLPGLRFHTLGVSALALIVHPDNPIDELTVEQARAIFAGRIRHWRDLPVPAGRNPLDRPIWPVSRLHCKQRPGHWRAILDHEDLFSPQMNEVGSIPAMIHEVASFPDAIGYEVLYDIERYVGSEGRVKVLRIDGMDPRDDAHLLAARYPFYRAHNIALWEDKALRKPLAQSFLDAFETDVTQVGDAFGVIPVGALRKAGWRFVGGELVGEPP
ncbi:hypothetical protein MAIT1_03351 [Magnetofaba australis IT-1]|uniref:PBP domain-containing protein n=2 Tax=Magnetofaba TaxID=1472292 RepID=A0A1Y2K699_9PROT|nr:hypothetical protein MAIT1_03351 [Magnetofaba australis IT-1]